MTTICLPGFLGTPEDFPRNGIPLPRELSSLLQYGKNLRLIGYSMGGRIALQFAYHYPDRVQEVIAISANPGIPDHEKPARADWENQWLEAMHQTDFFEKWYAQDLFTSLRNSSNFSKILKRRKKTDLETARKHFDHWRLSKQPNLSPHLPNLPVQFIFGELDIKYLPIHNRLKKMGVPTQLIPNCGHAPHLEKPQIFSIHEFNSR